MEGYAAGYGERSGEGDGDWTAGIDLQVNRESHAVKAQRGRRERRSASRRTHLRADPLIEITRGDRARHLQGRG